MILLLLFIAIISSFVRSLSDFNRVGIHWQLGHPKRQGIRSWQQISCMCRKLFHVCFLLGNHSTCMLLLLKKLLNLYVLSHPLYYERFLYTPLSWSLCCLVNWVLENIVLSSLVEKSHHLCPLRTSQESGIISSRVCAFDLHSRKSCQTSLCFSPVGILFTCVIYTVFVFTLPSAWQSGWLVGWIGWPPVCTGIVCQRLKHQEKLHIRSSVMSSCWMAIPASTLPPLWPHGWSLSVTNSSCLPWTRTTLIWTSTLLPLSSRSSHLGALTPQLLRIWGTNDLTSPAGIWLKTLILVCVWPSPIWSCSTSSSWSF